MNRIKTMDKLKINFRLSELNSRGIEELTLFVSVQYDTCKENGEYVPVTEDHEVIWDEQKRFNRDDLFPDDRGWIKVKD